MENNQKVGRDGHTVDLLRLATAAVLPATIKGLWAALAAIDSSPRCMSALPAAELKKRFSHAFLL